MPSFIASRLARSAALLFTSVTMFAVTPRPVADVLIPTPSGKPISLKSYRGKGVLMVVMSKDCDPCIKSIPLLNKIQGEFAGQGLQIVGAIGDPNAQYLLFNFVKQYKPNFPIGYLNKDQIIQLCDLGKNAQHATVPIFLFIDRKGMVREQVSGEAPFFKSEESSTRAMVQALLKQ